MQDELVSKQAVLEQINCWIGSGEYKYAMSERFLIDRIKTLQPAKQEPCRDIEEIAEVMKSDADAETKCKMISNIITAKPHYFEKQEPKITTYYTNEKGQRIQVDYDILDIARITREQLEILLEAKGFRKCGEE